MLRTFLAAAVLVTAAGPSAGRQSRPGLPEEARTVELDGSSREAYVDPATGAPSWLIDVDGLVIDLGGYPELATASQAEDRVRAFIVRHSDALALDTGALDTPVIRSYGDLWFVAFGQVRGGRSVWSWFGRSFPDHPDR